MILPSANEPVRVGGSFECPAPHETLPGRFNQIARLYDTRPALASSTWHPTYAELDAVSDHRSRAIAARSGRPGERVAILMRHDSRQIDAVLAVLKAGRIVVVLNPTDAPARLRLILEDAAASLIVADSTHMSLAGEIADTCACYDDLASADDSRTLPRLDAEATAFIVYTSGSAGRPKGVMMNHQQILHNALRLSSAMELSANDKVALLPSLSGLHGVNNLWCALLHGAVLQPFPVMERGVTGLADWMSEHRTTAFSASTSLFRSFMKSMAPGQRIASVRVVRIGGEPADSDDFLAFQQHFLPDSVLVNTLASSEAGNITYLRLSASDTIAEGPLPVGRTFPGMEIGIRDDDDRPAALGEAGQIIVKSRYMSQGYWRNEALTLERYFIDGDDKPAIRSGDWGRINQDGELEFVGRRDTRVKIHGSSVELEEVERTLCGIADVERAVVCAFEGPFGTQLAAFVVPRDGRELSSPRLRRAARSLLPGYMIPSIFQVVNDLPLMSHGKIDRYKLHQSLPQVTRPPVACETESETRIATIWTEAFDLPEVGRDDNFYDLGGDSLIASLIAARVYSETGVELDLETFADHPTVADLARFVDLRQDRSNQYRSPIRPVEGERKAPLSFAQQRIWDFCQTDSGFAGYVLSALHKIDGPLDAELLRACMNRLAARHGILRTTFEQDDDGPRQFVHPPGEVSLTIHDLTTIANPVAAMRELIVKHSSQLLNLQRGPLLHFALIKTGESEHRLLRVIHHIIYDSYSWDMYVNELAELYDAAVHGREPPSLNEARSQYADYARWQREFFRADAPGCAKMVAWWKKELALAPQPPDWPAKRLEPPATIDPSEGRHLCDIDDANWQRMADIAVEQKATLFVVWLAAFSAFLCAETLRSDIAIGAYASNRKRPEWQRVFGDLSNLVTLRLRCELGDSFRTWVSRTREIVTSAMAYSEVPYEELRRSFAAHGAILPEIRGIFLLEPAKPPVRFAGLKVALEEAPSLRRMPWGFTLVLKPSRRESYFSFDAALYDPGAVRAAAPRWRRFVDMLSRRPDMSMGQSHAMND